MKHLCFVMVMAVAAFAGQAGFMQETASTLQTTSATSLSFNLTQGTTAGDLNCVAVALDGANALTVTVSSVTDGGDTYSKVVSKTQSGTINEDSELWCASNIAAGKTAVTVTISGALGTSGGIQVIQVEYSGVDTGSVASITNATASNSNAGSSTASTTITPTGNALVVAFVNCSPVNSVGTGFRFRGISPSGGNTTNNSALVIAGVTEGNIGNAYQDKLNAANTSYTPTFNLASSDNWAMVAAAFTVTTGNTNGVADLKINQNGSSPNATAPFSNPDGGNTFVCGYSIANSTGTLTSIKDQANTAFTVSTHSPAVDATAGATVYLDYLPNVSAGNETFTATTSGGTANDVIWCYELFGVASSPFDTDNKATGNSGTSIALPSITTSGTDELIAVGQGQNTITGTSNSWASGGIFSGQMSTFKTNQTSGTYNANFTQNTAGTWAVVLAGFKKAVAGSTPKGFPTVQ